MIISHKYKYIFIKTKKTAGTSIEVALSEFCGPDDVITPVDLESEKIKKELGFPGPQNCELKSWRTVFQKEKAYRNHLSAQFVRRHVGAKVWDSYFKFCFERNPFDKAISRYYWSTKHSEVRPDLSEYLATARESALSSWKLYTIGDRLAVDFVGRFENLQQDLQTVAQRIGLPGELSLPTSKSGFRSDKRHYREVLSPSDRQLIERVCAREIEFCGYQW